MPLPVNTRMIEDKNLKPKTRGTARANKPHKPANNSKAAPKPRAAA